MPTIEELAVKLIEIDNRGSDAYHACATYLSSQNRRGGNAAFAQAFWADVDVGEGKLYATVETAIQACDEFCARASLHVPGIIRSGGGIHLYWPLARPLSRGEWLPVAQRLKLLMHAQGFHADPSRTADIASILRPPTTHNYKLSAARQVEIDDIDLFEAVPCEEFINSIINLPLEVTKGDIKNGYIFSANSSGSGSSGTDATKTHLQSGSGHGINNSLTAGISKAFDTTRGVAAGSRGFNRVRYAGELVAKGFSQPEVLAKLLTWDALCQPPEGEAACIHSMKSAFSMHAVRHPVPPAPTIVINTEQAEELPKLPFGYAWGNSNELLVEIKVPSLTEKGQYEIDRQVVSKWPVYLKAQLNQEGFDDNCGYLFWQYHSREGWKEITMSSEEMNGEKWYAYWYKRGGEILLGMDKHFRNYVRRASAMLRDEKDKLAQYNQFGWKNEGKAFLVGPYLCKSDGTYVKAYGTPKLQPLMEAMRPAKNGSLQAWSSAANKLFMPGLEPHAFALLCSFASTIMNMVVDDGNGGSIVSLVSEKSGTGKTPSATAVASVWGELGATIDTGNFTENRLIEDMVRHNHLPVVREEMPYSDPQIAADGTKKFTSGSDRGRLNQAGAASGMPERYQTILLSISNKSLFDLVKIADEPMSRRIFEIRVPRPDPQELENLGGIVREMLRNCGHAGFEFIRYAVMPQMRAYMEEHLQDNNGKIGRTQQMYRDKLKSQAEDRFIVWPVTCVDVVARILVNTGILTFDVERMMAWVTKQAYDCIHAEEMVNGIAIAPAVQKLTLFLSEHSDCCVVMQRPYERGQQVVPLRIPQKRVGMRMEMQPHRLFIANAFLKDWCTRRGINWIELGKELAELKIVVERSRQVTLAAGTSAVSGRETCWEVDMNHPTLNGMPRLAEVKDEMIKSGAA